MVTIVPRKTASRVLPCEPTRYAPTNAFPCPGVMACKLPRTNDNKNAPIRNNGENCCTFTSPISAEVTIVGLPAICGDGFELERFPAICETALVKLGRFGVPLFHDVKVDVPALDEAGK